MKTLMGKLIGIYMKHLRMLRLGRTLGSHLFSFSGGQLAYFNVLELLSEGLRKKCLKREESTSLQEMPFVAL